QIEDLVSGAPETVSLPSTPRVLSLRQRVLPWAIAAVAIVAAAGVVVSRAPWRATLTPAAPVRMSAAPATDVSMAGGFAFGSLALSPDGTTFAFVGTTAGNPIPQIFARRLSQLQATPL